MSKPRVIAVILLCFGAWCISVTSGGSAPTHEAPDWTLNDDHTHMIGRLSQRSPVVMSLDVRQVEQMMGRLAELRASMEPPRPLSDPTPGSVMIVPNMGRWFIQKDPGNTRDVIVMILHPGYGWVPLRLGPAEMRNFTDALRQLQPKP